MPPSAMSSPTRMLPIFSPRTWITGTSFSALTSFGSHVIRRELTLGVPACESVGLPWGRRRSGFRVQGEALDPGNVNIGGVGAPGESRDIELEIALVRRRQPVPQPARRFVVMPRPVGDIGTVNIHEVDEVIQRPFGAAQARSEP